MIQRWLRRHPILKYRGACDTLGSASIETWRDALLLIEGNGREYVFSASNLCKYFLRTADFLHPVTRRGIQNSEVLRAIRCCKLNAQERKVLLTTFKYRTDIRAAVNEADSLPLFLQEECGAPLDGALTLAERENVLREALMRGAVSSEEDLWHAIALVGAEDPPAWEQPPPPTSEERDVTTMVLDEIEGLVCLELASYERAVRVLAAQTTDAPQTVAHHRLLLERRLALLVPCLARRIREALDDIARWLELHTRSHPGGASRHHPCAIQQWFSAVAGARRPR